jgi:hypothetical protein
MMQRPMSPGAGAHCLSDSTKVVGRRGHRFSFSELHVERGVPRPERKTFGDPRFRQLSEEVTPFPAPGVQARS